MKPVLGVLLIIAFLGGIAAAVRGLGGRSQRVHGSGREMNALEYGTSVKDENLRP